MARNEIGLCRVCGAFGPLTREHGIPESAGNEGRLAVHSLDSMSRGLSRGEIFQNGLTRTALCERCNYVGGKHYVRPFALWTQQAVRYHRLMSAGETIFVPFAIVPLAIAKQLAVLTLSMSLPASINLPHFRELRRFAADPERQGVIESFRFYTYLHYGDAAFDGPFGAIDTAGGPSPTLYCQVGREPLGYIVTADDPASRLAACAAALDDYLA